MIRKRIYNSIFKLNGHPIIAKPLKKFAESKVSKPLVGSFANVYKLDMDEADRQLADYQSLHHLFTRRLKEGVREVAAAEDAFVSPCDGVLSTVDDLTMESTFVVKGQTYTVEELLGSKQEAEKYAGGQVLIFYLSPVNYHRVHVSVDADVRRVYAIGRDAAPVNDLGLTYSLRPLTRNYRLIADFEAGGHSFAQVMVGALNVNTIERTNMNDSVKKGEEFGYFSFGSTVVTCVPKGALTFNGKIGPVKMGEQVGTWR
ncbi:phosphatidylserine decarboxylase [Paenalkalicoccus suaedae]|uniref:phosphatidylserine decarboxylase n=1 Tax=Paenalkalicoccus suaedae TaxID=2592382 RepID=A0A859FJP3_9BACI|nr:phosphatidylserine decarboxylase [Paenalkalicoccus suaedae]QKS73025.1 phosphatidylserine decarboxylase [Paenalkalicoccus suaedae]